MGIGSIFERVSDRIEGELARLEEWSARANAFLTRVWWRQPLLVLVLVVLGVFIGVLKGHSAASVVSNLVGVALFVGLVAFAKWVMTRLGSRHRRANSQP
jgi:hypothetical protein